MEKEKTIQVLYALIAINSERIEVYENAIKETRDQDLKTLFAQFKATSHKCMLELISEVTKLGGKKAENAIPCGKSFYMWMNILRIALKNNNRKDILKSCEYGEDIAVATYYKALRNNMKDITAELQMVINAQHISIKDDYNKIKSMRDALAYTKINHGLPPPQSTVKHSWF